MALQTNKALKDAFAGEHGIAADLVSNGKLQQASWQQKEQKTQTVLGDDVRPPDELAAALSERHKNDAWTQGFQHVR